MPNPKKKLILHIDVGGTFILHSSITNMSVPESLSFSLSGLTWGKETDGKWKVKINSISAETNETSSDLISYYSYLEKTCANRNILRKQACKFIETQPSGILISKYIECISKLMIENSNEQEITGYPVCIFSKVPHKQFHKKLSIDSKKEYIWYIYIIEAFINLVDWLQRNYTNNYAIILRSYGFEGERVLKILLNMKINNHPQFQGDHFNNIYIQDPNLKKNIILKNNTVFIQIAELDSINIIHESYNIYKYFSQLNGINSFRDDYYYYQSHNYSQNATKPFFVQQDDQKHHHIFIDDSIRITPNNCGIFIQTLKKFKSIQLNHIFQSAHLVTGNIMEAIIDKDYFIDKIINCIKNDNIFKESISK
ncbi:hypothetical protein A3Q56_03893 [Intoshia linei]|uniref:Uncharacterized protein n=1 Tax=Intoshia linei TaxID=1819745 RepID=A0A177B4P1_9BILA|nr:hypothetical protein A3Q56_03893 [Intoshia linei]